MSTSPPKGRGRAGATKDLITEMIGIAAEIRPCSVRALAYQLFNRKLIPSMAKQHTAKVSRLCVIAREEGDLPWSWIVDSTRQEERVPTWNDPIEYAGVVQRAYRRNKWAAQPKHISVWSEKSTVEGTLRPILQKYEVPFQVLHGWSGATPIKDAADANLERSQDTLILYVGDYDPSGMGMSELDLPKRLARYTYDRPADFKEINAEDARSCLIEVRMELRRIALTKDHTSVLGNSSRFPVYDKKSDSRYLWFVENYGHSCWELDAMSPIDLRSCVEAAIVAELDREAWDRYVAVEEAERKAIVETCSNWKSILQRGTKNTLGRRPRGAGHEHNHQEAAEQHAEGDRHGFAGQGALAGHHPPRREATDRRRMGRDADHPWGD